MSEQTGDVLAAIDAALDGWVGGDRISPDAMRWAPEEPAQADWQSIRGRSASLVVVDEAFRVPPAPRRQLTPEEAERIAAALRQVVTQVGAALREAFGPGSEFSRAVRRFAELQSPPRPPAPKMPKVHLTVETDPRWARALEVRRSLGTGPPGPKLDGRR